MSSKLLPSERHSGFRRGRQGGFTLLEVILAIAILGIAMTAIAEVMRLSFRNAQGTADKLEGRLVAESVLAELKSGARPLVTTSPEQLASDVALSDWGVEVIVEPGIVAELLQVRVRVDRNLVVGEPAALEVVRWFPNPDFAVVPLNPGIGSNPSTTMGGGL